MLAVDTNVIVRLIVADDGLQARRARLLFAENPIFLAKTVLLETEWVLRRNYGLPATRVHSHLTGLAGLPQVTLESPDHLALALDWFEQGMDFADALRLAAATREGCDAFASFDRKLIAGARKARAFKFKAL